MKAGGFPPSFVGSAQSVIVRFWCGFEYVLGLGFFLGCENGFARTGDWRFRSGWKAIASLVKP